MYLSSPEKKSSHDHDILVSRYKQLAVNKFNLTAKADTIENPVEMHLFKEEGITDRDIERRADLFKLFYELIKTEEKWDPSISDITRKLDVRAKYPHSHIVINLDSKSMRFLLDKPTHLTDSLVKGVLNHKIPDTWLELILMGIRLSTIQTVRINAAGIDFPAQPSAGAGSDELASTFEKFIKSLAALSNPIDRETKLLSLDISYCGLNSDQLKMISTCRFSYVRAFGNLKEPKLELATFSNTKNDRNKLIVFSFPSHTLADPKIEAAATTLPHELIQAAEFIPAISQERPFKIKDIKVEKEIKKDEYCYGVVFVDYPTVAGVYDPDKIGNVFLIFKDVDMGQVKWLRESEPVLSPEHLEVLIKSIYERDDVKAISKEEKAAVAQGKMLSKKRYEALDQARMIVTAKAHIESATTEKTKFVQALEIIQDAKTAARIRHLADNPKPTERQIIAEAYYELHMTKKEDLRKLLGSNAKEWLTTIETGHRVHLENQAAAEKAQLEQAEIAKIKAELAKGPRRASGGIALASTPGSKSPGTIRRTPPPRVSISSIKPEEETKSQPAAPSSLVTDSTDSPPLPVGTGANPRVPSSLSAFGATSSLLRGDTFINDTDEDADVVPTRARQAAGKNIALSPTVHATSSTPLLAAHNKSAARFTPASIAAGNSIGAAKEVTLEFEPLDPEILAAWDRRSCCPPKPCQSKIHGGLKGTKNCCVLSDAILAQARAGKYPKGHPKYETGAAK